MRTKNVAREAEERVIWPKIFINPRHTWLVKVIHIYEWAFHSIDLNFIEHIRLQWRQECLLVNAVVDKMKV